MSPNEAFKLGFLSRCVEEGLSSSETAALAKQASVAFEKEAVTPLVPAALNLGSTAFKGLTDLVKTPLGLAKDTTSLVKDVLPAGMLMAALPPAAGGLAAVLKNTATDISDADVDEAKQQELVDTYRRMAEQLKRQRAARDYKNQSKRSGRVFL
jgi:hypothetical protein